MTYRLFIDDEREANLKDDDVMVLARTSKEAIDYMVALGCPEYISFDHDLGGDDTALKIVKWMIDTDIEETQSFIPDGFKFYVHSQNPIGKENIEAMLTRYLAMFPRK